MMKKLFTLLLICGSLQGISQDRDQVLMSNDNTGNSPKFSVGFSPLSLPLGKVRFDLETGIGKQNPILISIAPIAYIGSTSIYSDTRNLTPEDQKNRDYTTDNLSGFGTEFGIKFSKAVQEDNLILMYVGAGAGLHNIKLDYLDYDWRAYTADDGLEYYHYEMGPEKETIKRTDIFGMVGTRIYANKFVFFDGNVGIVYQNSEITTTSSNTELRPHRNGPIELGYTGMNLRANFSIGFSIF